MNRIHPSLLAIARFIAALSIGGAAAAQTVWHVDADAPPSGDGLSWATAFDDLQPAMELAMPGDSIWLAEGTYVPSVIDPIAGEDQPYFLMPDGVAILGGFNGSETDESQRDPDQFRSIISGDLLDNDLDTPVTGRGDPEDPDVDPDMLALGDSLQDNTGTLLFVDRTGPGTRLDGLVFTGAHTPNNHDIAASPRTRNGIFLVGASLDILNCRLERNITNASGPLYIYRCGRIDLEEPELGFTHPCNAVVESPARSTVRIEQTDFIDNYTQFADGVDTSAQLSISIAGSDLAFIESSIVYTLGRHEVEDPFAEEQLGQGGFFISGSSTAQLYRSVFRNCAPNVGDNSTAVQPVIRTLGDLDDSSRSPTIEMADCLFNRCVSTRGGIIGLFSNSDFSAIRCRFEGTLFYYNDRYRSVSVAVIGRYTDATGDSSFLLQDSTFVGTALITPPSVQSVGLPALVSPRDPFAVVQNCTLVWPDSVLHSDNAEWWSNETKDPEPQQQDNLFFTRSSLAAGHFIRPPSDGGDGWGDDPATPDIDESANDDYGDLRLRPNSPAIDRADASMVAPGATDLAGNPRAVDDTGLSNQPGFTLDLGAYEFQGTTCTPDVNGDGIADTADFFAWVQAFGSNGPGCDVNRDGECSSPDFFAWVQAFGQGC